MSRSPLALIATAILLALMAAPASAAPTPRALTLRLADLDPGYALLFGTCDAEPALAEAVPFANRNCVIEFTRLWSPPQSTPGPAVVLSAAAVFKSATRAAAALAYPRLVASLAFDPDREDFKVVAPAPQIGDEAVLLREADGSAVVIWRSGAVLGAVLAGHGLLHEHGDVDVETALALAAAQQARIASPTPLQPKDDDDREVALDDPGLERPVWWLGRKLPRHGTFPALRLLASVPGKLYDAPDADLYLQYGRDGALADVTLLLARPGLLRRPFMRRELRRMRHDPCMRVRRAVLAHGRATIFQRSSRCPRLRIEDTPDALADTSAIVVLHGVVVLVYADDCVSCHGPISRYESVAGMRRIVRALQPRESDPPQPPG